MASGLTVSIFLLSILLSKVNSQQKVVSVNTIQDGGSFMVYCDAKGVTIIPSSVTSIDTLTLIRLVSTDQIPTLIAEYRSFPAPGFSAEVKNIPSSRQWDITFSGANGGSNNRNTMKIEMFVPDALCSDAGLYICGISVTSIPSSISKQHNVASESAAKFFTFTPNPDNRLLDSENPDYSEYREGNFITITCRVNGPQDLRINWYQRSEDGFGGGFFTPYPYNNDITTPEAMPKPNATCNEYQHETKLSLNLTILNDQMTYKCAVEDNGQEIMSGNMTIGITSMNSQQNVVSVNTIQDGGSFMVYCDANRVTIPSGVTYIDTLKLNGQVGTAQTPTTIAQYKSFVPVGQEAEIKNIPFSRKWNITFSGANGGKNRNTMKIEMFVPDAQCSDAGLYICEVTYWDTTSTTLTTHRKQNVTSESAAKFFTLTPNPDNRLLDSENPDYSEYGEGEFVTITCRVDGPHDLGFNWYQRSEDGFGNNFFAPYPYNNDITTPAANPKPGATCNEYQHQTTLSLNLTILNDQMTYKCGVNDQGQEVMSGNLTIGVGSTPSDSDKNIFKPGDEVNIGAIAGGVTAGILFILVVVLVIYIIILRRKGILHRFEKRESNSGETHTNPPERENGSYPPYRNVHDKSMTYQAGCPDSGTLSNSYYSVIRDGTVEYENTVSGL